MRERFNFNEDYQQVAFLRMNQVIELAQQQNLQGLLDLKTKYSFSVNACIYNETALFKLAKRGKKEAVYWLITLFHGDPQEALRGAASNGLIEFSYALIREFELHEYAAVLGASSTGQKAFAQELLKKYDNRSLDAAVYGAAIYGDTKWVLELLDQGADCLHAIKGAVAGLNPFLIQKIVQRSPPNEIYCTLVMQTLYEFGYPDKLPLFFEKSLKTFAPEWILGLIYRAASNGDIKNVYFLLEYLDVKYSRVISRYIQRGAIQGSHPELLIALINHDRKQFSSVIQEVIKQNKVDFIRELFFLQKDIFDESVSTVCIVNVMLYPNEKMSNEIMKYVAYSAHNETQFMQVIFQEKNKKHLAWFTDVNNRAYLLDICSKIQHEGLRNQMLLLPALVELQARPYEEIKKNQLRK